MVAAIAAVFIFGWPARAWSSPASAPLSPGEVGRIAGASRDITG
jgi:hypothetical protein